MKAINIWVLGTVLFSGLVSCEMKDEIFGKGIPTETGYLTLKVTAGSSASVETKGATDDKEEFPLVIKALDFELTKSYESFAAFKEENENGVIKLPTGNYEIEAHSPGEFADKMKDPYYGGIEKITIESSLESTTTVKCKIQNVKIAMNFTAEFINYYDEWSITVDDKYGHSDVYTQENPDPAPVYWKMSAETDKIYVTGTATVKETGDIVPIDEVLTKKESADFTEGDDSPYFGGGDGLAITLSPAKEVELNKSGITITVEGFNQETNENIDIEVEVGEDPEKPEPPVTGDGPTITIPQDSYILPADIKSEATALMTSSLGLKSVKVKIVAGNESFEDALGLLPDMFPDDADKKAKVNLLEGVELMDNDVLPTVISMILNGKEIPIPSSGDTEYSFPVNNFFEALLSLGKTDTAAHLFEITVIDNNNKSESKNLSVTVN